MTEVTRMRIRQSLRPDTWEGRVGYGPRGAIEVGGIDMVYFDKMGKR